MMQAQQEQHRDSLSRSWGAAGASPSSRGNLLASKSPPAPWYFLRLLMHACLAVQDKQNSSHIAVCMTSLTRAEQANALACSLAHLRGRRPVPLACDRWQATDLRSPCHAEHTAVEKLATGTLPCDRDCRAHEAQPLSTCMVTEDRHFPYCLALEI